MNYMSKEEIERFFSTSFKAAKHYSDASDPEYLDRIRESEARHIHKQLFDVVQRWVDLLYCCENDFAKFELETRGFPPSVRTAVDDYDLGAAVRSICSKRYLWQDSSKAATKADDYVFPKTFALESSSLFDADLSDASSSTSSDHLLGMSSLMRDGETNGVEGEEEQQQRVEPEKKKAKKEQSPQKARPRKVLVNVDNEETQLDEATGEYTNGFAVLRETSSGLKLTEPMMQLFNVKMGTRVEIRQQYEEILGKEAANKVKEKHYAALYDLVNQVYLSFQGRLVDFIKNIGEGERFDTARFYKLVCHHFPITVISNAEDKKLSWELYSPLLIMDGSVLSRLGINVEQDSIRKKAQAVIDGYTSQRGLPRRELGDKKKKRTNEGSATVKEKNPFADEDEDDDDESKGGEESGDDQ